MENRVVNCCMFAIEYSKGSWVQWDQIDNFFKFFVAYFLAPRSDPNAYKATYIEKHNILVKTVVDYLGNFW